MPHIYKFSRSDKIINLVKTFPKVSFAFYNNRAYYDNKHTLSGAFSASILGVPSGYVSLYEQSIDRYGTLDFVTAELKSRLPQHAGAQADPFGFAVDTGTSPTKFYVGGPIAGVRGLNPTYAAFKIKDGTRISFKTVSAKQYNTASAGKPMHSFYPLSASIQKYFYGSGSIKFQPSYQATNGDAVTGAVSFLQALKPTMDRYSILNPNYKVSSSTRDLTASTSTTVWQPLIAVNPLTHGPGEGATNVGLVTIPTIFYGDSIKRGSIDLKYYVTGTLVGQLKDDRRNGDLIQVGPKGSPGSGSVAGVALYSEGFLVLTGSWNLNTAYTASTAAVYQDGMQNRARWINFAQTISGSNAAGTPAPAAVSSSCLLDFEGSHKVPTMMLFANAPKNNLNHSNNPTYRKYGSELYLTSGSTGYIQNPEALIKNTVSSSYNDPTGSFAKITYISKIGIYDKNKNLIGIAKLAKPVKKLEEREFTFKLKLDL